MKILLIIAAIALVLHGLIHLMGTVTYMRLGTIEGLTYKTTLMGGRWDLGEFGIGVYGAFWSLATLGFIFTSVSIFAGWSWSKPVLLSITLFSLALTILDWSSAYMGAILNIIILAVVWLAPVITNLLR